jgi:hypothetical protein
MTPSAEKAESERLRIGNPRARFVAFVHLRCELIEFFESLRKNAVRKRSSKEERVLGGASWRIHGTGIALGRHQMESVSDTSGLQLLLRFRRNSIDPSSAALPETMCGSKFVRSVGPNAWGAKKTWKMDRPPGDHGVVTDASACRLP